MQQCIKQMRNSDIFYLSRLCFFARKCQCLLRIW